MALNPLEIQRRQDEARLLLTSCVGFWVASDAIFRRSQEPGEMFHWPVFNLNACFSFELATKAFLAFHGATDKELRGLGHNLINGMNAAISTGYAPPHPAVRDVVDHLSPSHLNHDFRYLRDQMTDLVEPNTVLATTREHFQAVGNQIQVWTFKVSRP